MRLASWLATLVLASATFHTACTDTSGALVTPLCTTLSTCCPLLGAADVAYCAATVQAADDVTCADALVSYQAQGECTSVIEADAGSSGTSGSICAALGDCCAWLPLADVAGCQMSAATGVSSACEHVYADYGCAGRSGSGTGTGFSSGSTSQGFSTGGNSGGFSTGSSSGGFSTGGSSSGSSGSSAELCGQVPEICEVDSDCCSGLFCAGDACSATCGGYLEGCLDVGTSDGCCAGYECVADSGEGACQPVGCATSGSCSTNTDCCIGYYCIDDACTGG